MKINILIVIACMLLCCKPAVAQELTKDQQAKIDTIAERLLSANNIPGVAIGIVRGGSILYTKGYGTKRINEQEPIDSFTNFLTCSISKLFTATAIMQLAEQGKIDLNEKLTTYLPDFSMKDKRYRDITIRQILTHTSGLPNVYRKHYIRPKNDSTALTEFAHKLRHKKLSYPPGVPLSEKTYSNTGYNILGLVIERVTNMPYSSYIDVHVLRPAALDSSSFFYKHIPENRRSTPHKKQWLTGFVRPSRYYPDIPQDKPCGNLNSCTADLCHWMLHNLAIYNGKLPEQPVVSRSTLQDMWTTKEKIAGYTTSIGNGWWITESKKYGKYVFHDGNDPGFCAALIISPANDFGIVILCNALFPKDLIWNKLPFEIMDVFADNWKK